MKKLNQIVEIPMNEDPLHIYNILVEQGIYRIDTGYAHYEFELHANLKHGDQDVDGLTLFDQRKILLDMSLSDETARETVLHEIMHCVLEGLGLDERHFDQEQLKATNEQLATSLSLQFILLNRLNPKLMGVLFG